MLYPLHGKLNIYIWYNIRLGNWTINEWKCPKVTHSTFLYTSSIYSTTWFLVRNATYFFNLRRQLSLLYIRAFVSCIYIYYIIVGDLSLDLRIVSPGFFHLPGAVLFLWTNPAFVALSTGWISINFSFNFNFHKGKVYYMLEFLFVFQNSQICARDISEYISICSFQLYMYTYICILGQLNCFSVNLIPLLWNAVLWWRGIMMIIMMT